MTTTFAPASPAATRPQIHTEVTSSASQVDATDAPRERSDYVSIYVSSILAVSVLFFFGVGVPCWLFLDDALGGFGLGAMCAIWGGPSFGVMTASARVSARLEASESGH